MSFELKNTQAEFQAQVNKVFVGRIERNMEVYMDDIIIKTRKTKTCKEYGRNVHEEIESVGMKLYPKKCTFGVQLSKCIGLLISKSVIKVNVDKVKAIHDISPPQSVEDVQRLSSCIASLGGFLACMGK